MLTKIKEIKRNFLMNREIKSAYRRDCDEYRKWQYHNSKVKNKNAVEAQILRQTHIIEKGMSISSPRAKFGVQKALELLDMIDAYEAAGFDVELSFPVKNAIGVLKAYIDFHDAKEFKPDIVISRFEKYKKYLDKYEAVFGTNSIQLSELQVLIHGEFSEFFSSRHSVRQFLNKKVDIEDIKKAVSLAMHAPSACNRQPCKVYFYQDKEVNDAIGELIAGNTGFDGEVQNYLVITSDMSAFYDAFERNQVYVDGGILTMALVECLHYYGIASCVLQNGERKEKDLQFRKICSNIPDSEKIICFIAIGYYKDTVTFATSHRKTLDEVLKIK